MDIPSLRVRYIADIVVVGIGSDSPGEPIPVEVGLVGFCGEGRRVVLDLAGWSGPVSSAFLGHLIRAHQKSQISGGQLRVSCPPGIVRDTLAEVQFDRMFATFPSLDAALTNF
jgi:hypothetical protein